VVLSAAPGQPSTVNLLAPIVIDAETRTGTQVVLEGSRFSTRELFVMPEEKAAPAPEAQVAEAR
jgi:flagellar assembly factor FliW